MLYNFIYSNLQNLHQGQTVLAKDRTVYRPAKLISFNNTEFIIKFYGSNNTNVVKSNQLITDASIFPFFVDKHNSSNHPDTKETISGWNDIQAAMKNQPDRK